MRRFLPLLILGICACAEVSDSAHEPAGTVQGAIFDAGEATSGTVLIALADMQDGTPFIAHSVVVEATELPYQYSFYDVDPSIEYELLVFVDAGEPSDLEAMGDEDRLEFAADTVQADRVVGIRGVNFAL